MPQDNQKPPKAAQPPPVSLMRGHRPARVILCDDESIIRETICIFLRTCFKDYETVECSDGDAAWREISRQTPHLLITDSAHTGMHVEEMLYRLYRTSKFFPVIVCSGSLGLTCNRARLSGFTLFPVRLLDKPFTVQMLRLTVRGALDLPTVDAG